MEHSTGVFPSAGMPLADIRDVTVDPNLPKEERIAEFLRQIHRAGAIRPKRLDAGGLLKTDVNSIVTSTVELTLGIYCNIP